ncbi:MAG: hypothetical protein QOF01_4261, partial [Thermomicrobiales bacterium]|nr:hypothetical protein [Thermomicrobiales bacterium]
MVNLTAGEQWADGRMVSAADEMS